MSHITIIITSSAPPPPGTAAHASEVEASVTYRPDGALTPAQIGHEITRMVKLIGKIEGGED